MCLSLLTVICGDVELNPGPPRPIRANNRGTDSSQTSQDRTSGVYTRQRTLSSYTTPQHNSQQNTPTITSTRERRNAQDNDILSLLTEMKADMKTQHRTLSSDISQINSKLDSFSEAIQGLKEENVRLSEENNHLKQEMKYIKNKVDNLESHSRRNNLRFYGIPGKITESWDQTERTVRNVISDDLNLPELAAAEIERAHRVKSNEPDKCAIIVKFLRYKDCERILQHVRTDEHVNPDVSVKPDYTERVVNHRRELGKIMLDERNKGRYASIRYDKLIIEDTVYKYDEETSNLVRVGKRRVRQAHAPPRGNVNNNNTAATGLDDALLSDDDDDTGSQSTPSIRTPDHDRNNTNSTSRASEGSQHGVPPIDDSERRGDPDTVIP